MPAVSSGGSHCNAVDFGLVRPLQSSEAITAYGVKMGTPEYMPPEQWADASKADDAPAEGGGD